jgi:hypothetical protein
MRTIVAMAHGTGWLFRITDGPVQGMFILISDADSGQPVWGAVSDAYSEQVYFAPAEITEVRPLSGDPAETEEQVGQAFMAAGVDQEVLDDRGDLRPVAEFEYGVAPPGFRPMPEWAGAALLPGRRYAVAVIGGLALPAASGTFCC